MYEILKELHNKHSCDNIEDYLLELNKKLSKYLDYADNVFTFQINHQSIN